MHCGYNRGHGSQRTCRISSRTREREDNMSGADSFNRDMRKTTVRTDSESRTNASNVYNVKMICGIKQCLRFKCPFNEV